MEKVGVTGRDMEGSGCSTLSANVPSIVRNLASLVFLVASIA